jgi:hypothetical protein
MLATRVFLKKCWQVSLSSLLLGTAMLVLFFFSDNFLVAFVSAPVVLVIGLYNLKLLLQLVWRGRKEKENRKEFWRTAGIMSLNIPAALLYTKFVLMLSNALLVRLVNDTNQPLQHVVVLGCGEQRQLADLRPGQATILWLPISPACFERTVSVQYRAGNTTQQAIIDGYVVAGKRLNVKLSSSQQVAVTSR